MNARTVHLALRGTTAVLAALAAVLVLLAASFLSGHYPALQWHLVTGISMVGLALVQTVVVFLPGRKERPPSVMREGIFVPVVLAVQGVLGMYRILELHVPIGVLMAVGLTHMASWAGKTPLSQREKVAGA